MSVRFAATGATHAGRRLLQSRDEGDGAGESSALQSLTLGDGACEGEMTSRVVLRGLKELTTMRVGKRVWGLASEMNVSGGGRALL